MNLPDFLTEWPYGEIVITGRRLTLYHFIRDFLDGKNLSEWYPDLSAEMIEKILAFYHENKAEVDDYMTNYAEELRQQYAALGPSCDPAKLLRYFEQKKQAGR